MSDTGAEVVLDYTGSASVGLSFVHMDFHDETQVGQHTYGVNAKSEPAQEGESASVAVEFTGADADGRIVAEGNVLLSLEAMVDSTAFLAQTLDGLAALHGLRTRSRTAARARAQPPNAGQPWSEASGEQLRERWLRCSETSSGNELVGELAEEFGRTRSSIRAQLARLTCDPDVPGRELADTAPP